jgi:hypothetical protein
MPGVNQQSPFLTGANFQAAWAKVAKNNGCAGVDGETIAHFRRKADIYLADPPLFKSYLGGVQCWC